MRAAGIAIVFLIAIISMCFPFLAVSAATINYIESQGDISNPDRGFYYPYSTTTSAFKALNKNVLISRRTTSFTPFQGNYAIKTSIGLRHYVLDSFANVDILSNDFLNAVNTDFEIARQAGIRLVLRFSYTITPTAGSCDAGFICPPYGDAPKARVLAHIKQLQAVLQANSDVIMGVQQGFIGTWGENYYSDYFGDPSVNDDVGYLTNQNWQDRNDVVHALLNAVPKSRMLQLRYPQSKQRFIAGAVAPLSTPALTEGQAFQQTDIARLGMHNDCFVASEDDFGTFADYGNDTNPVSNGNSAQLKNYAEVDSKYTLVGGETCSDLYSPQNDCDSVVGGSVLSELARYSYTFLNSDYNNEVNNDWQAEGCMEEIKRRLGYRFVLRSIELPSTIAANGKLLIKMQIDNIGFAAAVNPRSLYLVLRKINDASQSYFFALEGTGTNVQHWLAATTNSVNATTTTDLNSVPIGEYQVLLHIADTSDSMRIFSRPEYSVQLANQGTWEPQTGFNKLNATILITAAETIDDDDFLLWLIPSILQKNN